MGNCQDQFQNVDQYQVRPSQYQKSKVLIDRTHKTVVPSKYQPNVGYLLNKESLDRFDDQRLYKSMALQKSKKIERNAIDEEKFIQNAKLTPLNLQFYHSLGLPEYSYKKKGPQLLNGRTMQNINTHDDDVYIHESQDRVGVVYVGQRNAQGKFHGNGVLTANTVQYIGQFLAGTKHAHGREIYSSEVYEGQFAIDIRRGKGVRYTEQYVDEGVYEKVILWGKRKFHNGNEYAGEFHLNEMHGKGRTSPNIQWSFKDMRNGLYYDGQIQFNYGQLIQAERVSKLSKDKNGDQKIQLIGSFKNGRIVALEQKKRQQQQQQMLSRRSIDDQTDLDEIIKGWD